jgi:FkbM family methyltransferase
MLRNHGLRVIDIEGVKLTIRDGIVSGAAVLPVLDEGICREVIAGDCYGLRTLRLPSRPTILDVGGHVGSFASFARCVYPGAAVHSFEPSPSNYQMLYLNSARHGYYAYNSAISGEPFGLKELSLNKHEGDVNTGGYVLVGDNNRKKMEVLSVLSAPLEGILSDLSKVDLLKMDAEGAEFSSLYHLSPANFSKIHRLRVEIHPHGEILSGIEFQAWLRRVLHFMKVTPDSPTPRSEISGGLQVVWFEKR